MTYNPNWSTGGGGLSNPTYIYAVNSNGQTLSVGGSNYQVNTWANGAVNDPNSQWNASTGTFTASAAGTYLVTANVTYHVPSNGGGQQYTTQIKQTGTLKAESIYTSQGNVAAEVPAGVASAVLTLATNDTITVWCSAGVATTLSTQNSGVYTWLTIQQIK